MSDKKKSKKKAKPTQAETPESKGTKKKKKAPTPYTIPSDHPWAGMWKMFAVVAVLGLGLAGYGYTTDPHRFPFSYVTAFGWGLTIALGALWFVLIQHLTRAGWSVLVRRGAEQLAGVLPLFALLFIPLWIFKGDLYPWASEAFVKSHPMVQAKTGYLNTNFWTARAVGYLGIWSFLSYRMFSLSRQQDESGDPKLTLKMQWLSAPGTLLFALTLTFAAFDWFMSMDPEWYSTMFGVYIFAGSVVSVMAFLSLLFSRMTGAGLLTKKVNTEHFHDLGKLTFAFTIFWAYISFCQYFLIWYANIPEETLFFEHRGHGAWVTISWVLVVGHFFFPFFLLLSRHAKRINGILTFGTVWVLLMHFLDLYWLCIPMQGVAAAAPHGAAKAAAHGAAHAAHGAAAAAHGAAHGFHPNIPADLGCLMFVAGLMLAVMFKRMADAPIVPIKDPRIKRSLRFENA